MPARLKRIKKDRFNFAMLISMFLHLIRLSRALPTCYYREPGGSHRCDTNDTHGEGRWLRREPHVQLTSC